MRSILFAFAAAAHLCCFAATAHAAQPNPSATLAIRATPIQPSAVPVLVTLIVRNTGPVPIAYWCSGPGDYPDARDFHASIHAAASGGFNSDLVPLANGQTSNDAGHQRMIVPGAIVQFPAALPPLPAGRYLIRVACDAEGHRENGVLLTISWPAQYSFDAISIEIRDDAELLARRDRELIARVRGNDRFAQYLAASSPRMAVRAALDQDLMGTDVIVAERAMDGLWGDGPPGELDMPLVFKAIQQHLQPPASGIDYAMMGRLLKAASRSTTPACEELMAKVAVARPIGHVHDQAVSSLAQMRNPPFITRRPPAPRAVPPEEYDRDAIVALLKLAKSLGASERKLAYMMLADYPKNPDAAAALRAGTSDPDPDAQAAARHSLLFMQ